MTQGLGTEAFSFRPAGAERSQRRPLQASRLPSPPSPPPTLPSASRSWERFCCLFGTHRDSLCAGRKLGREGGWGAPPCWPASCSRACEWPSSPLGPDAPYGTWLTYPPHLLTQAADTGPATTVDCSGSPLPAAGPA